MNPIPPDIKHPPNGPNYVDIPETKPWFRLGDV